MSRTADTEETAAVGPVLERGPRLAAIAAVFALTLPAVTAEAETRSERLHNGETLVWTVPVEGSEYPKVQVQAVVDAPLDVVWDILSSCEDSEKVNKRVSKSFVVKRIGSEVVCSETMDLPFPLKDLVSVTRWGFNPGPPVWIKKWSLVEGDFDYSNGQWRVEPYRGSTTRTAVLYENHFSPQMSVPSWLTRAFLKVGMPELIDDLREAAAARTK